MALTKAEFAALENLKNMPPAAKTPKSTIATEMETMMEAMPSDMEAMMKEPSATDLFTLLENNIQEMNFIIDEIIKNPDVKDPNVITFVSNLKGQLLTNARDITEIKRGTYRASESKEIPKEAGGESYIMPEVMPGESLAIKKPLPQGESYVSPMAQRLFT